MKEELINNIICMLMEQGVQVDGLHDRLWDNGIDVIEDVSHWMPLPEPPEQEGDAET